MSGRARAVLSDLDDTLFDHAHATRCALRTLRDEIVVLGDCPLDELERSGRPIGTYDTLIAAHALSRQHILVTANVGEFERVLQLRIENWQEAKEA